MRIRYGRWRLGADICITPNGDVKWKHRRFAVIEPDVAVDGDTRRIICVGVTTGQPGEVVISTRGTYTRRPYVRAVARGKRTLTLMVDPQ